jgi:hypothetical protein
MFPEMKQALIGDKSPASRALELVGSLEICDWERCDCLQYLPGLQGRAGDEVVAPDLHLRPWVVPACGSLCKS